jgi:hypothetical protein
MDILAECFPGHWKPGNPPLPPDGFADGDGRSDEDTVGKVSLPLGRGVGAREDSRGAVGIALSRGADGRPDGGTMGNVSLPLGSGAGVREGSRGAVGAALSTGADDPTMGVGAKPPPFDGSKTGVCIGVSWAGPPEIPITGTIGVCE